MSSPVLDLVTPAQRQRYMVTVFLPSVNLQIPTKMAIEEIHGAFRQPDAYNAVCITGFDDREEDTIIRLDPHQCYGYMISKMAVRRIEQPSPTFDAAGRATPR